MGDTPLVRGDFCLMKFPGKGGWTYAEIPGIPMNKNNPFGWVRVSGRIDDFILDKYKLMPMGNGHLFLPVKALIRKKIDKKAGDIVDIELFLDERPPGIPEELAACFENEPELIRKKFDKMPKDLKDKYLDRIYDAKSDDHKTAEIVKLLQYLSNE